MVHHNLQRTDVIIGERNNILKDDRRYFFLTNRFQFPPLPTQNDLFRLTDETTAAVMGLQIGISNMAI
jgi:hypothetical protein